MHDKFNIRAYQNNISVSCYIDLENKVGRLGLTGKVYIFMIIITDPF